MIKWLFFDLGSTLIDESLCEERRLRELLAQPGAPDRETLEKLMWENARKNRHPYKDTARALGLRTTPWPVELERVYPDAAPVLRELSGRYSLGVIANQSPGTAERLEGYGIGEYFKVVVASAEAGVAKPDRRIFLLALEKAGCAPEEACMVGDRLDNDIAPAASLGMKTAWVRQGPFRRADPVSLTPDITVDTIAGLLKYL